MEIERDNLLFDLVGSSTDEKNLHEKVICNALRNEKYCSLILSNLKKAYNKKYKNDKCLINFFSPNSFNVFEQLSITIEGKNNKRPIDIVLFGECEKDKKQNAIIFELKINARDQKNQLQDYYLGLSKEFDCNVFCVYVTPTGKGPSPNSKGILQEGIDYFPISYKVLCAEFTHNEELYSTEDFIIQEYYDLIDNMYVQKSTTLDNKYNYEKLYNSILEQLKDDNNVLCKKLNNGIFIRKQNSKMGIELYDKYIDGSKKLLYAILFNVKEQITTNNKKQLVNLATYWLSQRKKIYYPEDGEFEPIMCSSTILEHYKAKTIPRGKKGNGNIRIIFEQELDWLAKLIQASETHPYCQPSTVINWIKKDLDILEPREIFPSPNNCNGDIY